MSLRDFLHKQLLDVIDYTEPEDGILAYRYPMQDREIQNGGKLTVRDSQAAVFVNEGKVADVFGPGLYVLNTHTLPILTYLQNWATGFQSPFKSDVYFFSTRQQTNQRWGTAQPITIRDKEFGMVRLRAFGIFSYHVGDPKTFYSKISGTREIYRVADLDGQLRNTIIGRMTDTFAASQVPFLDMAANQIELGNKIGEFLKPVFADLGLMLDSFVVENLSLPDELQKVLDQRISMNMLGDMSKFTQYQVANSIPIAAANEGGLAGAGIGIGAGLAFGQNFAGAMQQNMQPPAQPYPQQQAPPPPQYQQPAPPPPPPAPPVAAAAPVAPAASGDTKFCMNCGKPIPKPAKFCPECGGAQG
jgi:membrane protease subunit (stomatin/prohibitin family)